MLPLNGVTHYAVYQESLLRIKNFTADYRDRVLVSMYEEILKKGEDIAALKKTIKERDKTIGEQNAAIEIFHSRVDLNICGQSNVGAYLKGLLTDDDIMKP